MNNNNKRKSVSVHFAWLDGLRIKGILLFIGTGVTQISAQSWVDLNNRFKELYSKRDYVQAQIFIDSALRVAARDSGMHSGAYVKSLNNQGVLYFALFKYDKSESYHLLAAELRKELYGAESAEYAISMNSLGIVYTRTGDYTKAEASLNKAEQIRKKIVGEKHLDYAKTISALGSLYEAMNLQDKAEKKHLQSYRIRKEILKSNSLDLAFAETSLGDFYKGTSQFPQAEVYYLLAIHTFSMAETETVSKEGPLNNLGVIYLDQQRWEEALVLFQKSGDLNLKYRGEESEEYGRCLNNQAIIFKAKGDFNQAESLYLKAARIREKANGPYSAAYAQTLGNLAAFYEGISDYTTASNYYLLTYKIYKEHLGFEDPGFIPFARNLANLSRKIGKVEITGEMLNYIELDVKKRHGENSMQYADVLNDLGNYHLETKEFEIAEKEFRFAMKIQKDLSGFSSAYALSKYSLGILCKITNRVEEQEKYISESVELKKQLLGKDHPDLISFLLAESAMYRSLGKHQKANTIALELQSLIASNSKKNFQFLSNSQKEEIAHQTFHHYEYIRSCFSDAVAKEPALAGDLYNSDLLTKGMVLSSGIEMRQKIQQSKDTFLLRQYDQWIALSRIVTKEYNKPESLQRLDLDSLEKVLQNTEKSMMRKSSSLRHSGNDLNADWKSVRDKLGPNEVAIEFTYFKYHGLRDWTDTIIYAALIIRKERPYPEFVKLCNSSELESVFTAAAIHGRSASGLYRSGSNISTKIAAVSSGKKLYDLIWKPLDTFLNAGDRIYFSTNGLLHQIAFAAIPYKKDSMLCDRYTLIQMGSTAKLLLNDFAEKANKKTILLLGGIEYNELESFENNKNSETWSYLNGTLEEAQMINDLGKKQGFNAHFFSGKKASENIVYAECDNFKPAIVHFSTHGFFFPDPRKDSSAKKPQNNFNAKSLDPMLRSGLVMAGANISWTDRSLLAAENDGILTAREAGSLNLLQTDVVVLSACETGLGDITESEGVFGLQRAFKLAGVNYLVMSLWKVPDAETAEFMKIFYAHIFNGSNYRDAFTAAQRTMRHNYPSDPSKWAAFIMIQ